MHPAQGTLVLRLEGPLQAWGDHRSKFVVRSVMPAPTKSGLLGLICAAMGLNRAAATARLPELRQLAVGVRVDRAGWLWADYHTVGAGIGNISAEGKVKITQETGEIETFVTRREYLADAAFVAVLQGPAALISEIKQALRNPVWGPYLGRKACPPSRPLLAPETDQEAAAEEPTLAQALQRVPWYKRWAKEPVPPELDAWVEWRPTPDEPEAPPTAQVWYDEPASFMPPVHYPRFVVARAIAGFPAEDDPTCFSTPSASWPHADYTNEQYKQRRRERLARDEHVCVVCKLPAGTVQHITYRRAGGRETLEDLRSVCRLCHDAITMIEYGENFGLDRIDPCDGRWHREILETRERIIRFRSEERRRRLLEAQALEEED